MLAAGTGFTDTLIRRGRYPDFKGPLPFTPGYDLVGVVEKTGPGVTAQLAGQMVADLCVVGGYAQYAIRPARFLVPVPDGVDPAEAVCIPLAYLTAYQMLTRYRHLPRGATILVIGASGTVGTALLDLARHLGLKAIGTCSAANLAMVERFGATAIDYRAGDFVAAVRRLTAGRKGGVGVDTAFDAIGGAHFARSFACLAPGGLLVGYGAQTMAVGGAGLASAALGLARLKLWNALSGLFGGRRAVFYSITARRDDAPGGIQGRHGHTVRPTARPRHPSRRYRPTASRGRARGPHPHRYRRTRRQDRAAAVVRGVISGIGPSRTLGLRLSCPLSGVKPSSSTRSPILPCRSRRLDGRLRRRGRGDHAPLLNSTLIPTLSRNPLDRCLESSPTLNDEIAIVDMAHYDRLARQSNGLC